MNKKKKNEITIYLILLAALAALILALLLLLSFCQKQEDSNAEKTPSLSENSPSASASSLASQKPAETSFHSRNQWDISHSSASAAFFSTEVLPEAEPPAMTTIAHTANPADNRIDAVSASSTAILPGSLPSSSAALHSSLSSPEMSAFDSSSSIAASVPASASAASPVVIPSAAAVESSMPATETMVHSCHYGPWQMASEPGCTSEGRELRSCSCGRSESRTLAALGHAWHSEKVLSKAAWDEQVLVKEAWTEQILVKEAWEEEKLIKEAWTEEIKEIHWFCDGCGMDQTVYEKNHGLLDSNGKWTEAAGVWETNHAKEHLFKGESSRTYEAWVVVDTITHPAEYRTVHHPAEYQIIPHEAEYKTVHHEAEYKEITKCSRCGITK